MALLSKWSFLNQKYFFFDIAIKNILGTFIFKSVCLSSY